MNTLHVKVIRVYHYQKMFITLVWNVKQSFNWTIFIIIIVLPISFYVCQTSIHCFIIELQYNYIKLYTIVHIKSLQNEDIVNVNILELLPTHEDVRSKSN